jgi:hypothetical protein
MSNFRRMLMGAKPGHIKTIMDYVLILPMTDLTVSFRASSSEGIMEYGVVDTVSMTVGEWSNLGTTSITVPARTVLALRGNLVPTARAGIGRFLVSGDYSLSGNCMSLLFGDEAGGKLSLAEYNYAFRGLFARNNGLIGVSETFLPATELSGYCYSRMFSDCISLSSAPKLPALYLRGGCYEYMFSGCGKLEYIDARFLTTPGVGYTDSWVSGVSSTGIFVQNAQALWFSVGVNAIPEGWAILQE